MSDSRHVVWTWRRVCRALRLEEVAGPDIYGICIDSRRAQPGDLFIALTGDPGPRFNPSQRSQRDGHDFVTAAMESGAVGALVHDMVERDIPQLQVVDTLAGLWHLAAAARARLNCPVVAITGSSGKTTTKDMLAAALRAFSTAGSLNNHLGVPLSLASTPSRARAAVYEVGTSHPGEIAPLAELVRPNAAIVLNVHPAHAQNFRDMHQLRIEKLSIYKGLLKKGYLIVEDQILTDDVPEHVQITRFGRTDRSDVRLSGMNDRQAQYRVANELMTAYVPGGGEHRALSLAAVLAACTALKQPMELALNLADELVPHGRGDEISVGGITIVDDSYNANPESMKVALTGLAAYAGRTVAVLGEMLELGEEELRYHRALAENCRTIDKVACVGDRMRVLNDGLAENQRLGWFPQADDKLLEAIASALRPDDRILVKGSNRVFWAHKFVDRLVQRLQAFA